MCHANSVQRIKLTHTYCKSGTRQIAGHCKRGYATLWKVKREGMQQMSTKIQQIIEWRRAEVMELLSKGESNQYEIVRILQDDAIRFDLTINCILDR